MSWSLTVFGWVPWGNRLWGGDLQAGGSWTTPVREAGVARRGHGAQTHCGGGLCRSHRELESWHGLFKLVLDRAICFQMWAAPWRAQGCRLLLSTETKQKVEAKGQRKALEGNEWYRWIIWLSIGYAEEIWGKPGWLRLFTVSPRCPPPDAQAVLGQDVAAERLGMARLEGRSLGKLSPTRVYSKNWTGQTSWGSRRGSLWDSSPRNWGWGFETRRGRHTSCSVELLERCRWFEQGRGKGQDRHELRRQCHLEKSKRQTQKQPVGRHRGFMAKDLNCEGRQAVWIHRWLMKP